jgi:tripartite ATP-independent transporter DctM subunit
MIPPSIIMVVYAVAAEVSIVRVFIAGMIPGAIVMGLFSLYIVAWALLNPKKQPPPGERLNFVQKLRQSAQLIPCILLIIGVIGTMFAGLATATEAAAFGVLGSLILAAVTGSLSWRNFLDSLAGATRLSCMIMFILAGAAFLTKAMALTGIPAALAAAVAAAELGPYAIIAILTVVYLILGTALDGVSMIVLTTSVVVPMVPGGGLRPGVVRHLHHPAGRDRRDIPAARLQPVRDADDDGQGADRDRHGGAALLHDAGGDGGADHAVPGHRHLAAGHAAQPELSRADSRR